jgi:catechol 2,3-dioxygenase-like lactoylglutathione lyase family enzyme
MSVVQKLSRIRMVCQDAQRLASFYESAFGFSRSGETQLAGSAFASLVGIPGAEAHITVLALASQKIELISIDPQGEAYPSAVPVWSPLFQHFAIVVSSMEAAYARLQAVTGWTPISTEGPQLLPAASGGVTAFKFRDPEGHPLELLAFPSNAVPEIWGESRASGCLGIDHSAISVANTYRSVSFYQRLGLQRTGGSYNTGPAQDKLDNIKGAVVEVTALAPPEATPHVELLCYRETLNRNARLPGINGAAATQLILAVEGAGALHTLCAQNPAALYSGPIAFADNMTRAMMRDPDGHLLCLEAPR